MGHACIHSRCACKCGRWEQALSLRVAMERAQISPTVVTFNSLIDACGRSDQHARAVSLFEELEASDTLAPDVVTYNVLIATHGRAGLAEQALAYLDRMRQARLRPDLLTYNSLISACEKAGWWQKALHLLYEMRGAAGLTPDVVSYSAAISPRSAHDLPTISPRSPQVSYSAAISACEKGHEWQRALQLLEEMATAGVAPNVYSYSAAISACEKGARWEEALRNGSVTAT